MLSHIDIEILIVDDNPINLELAVRQVARLGYKTAKAVSGWEAVAAVQQKVYNLILMDYQMPELDGCEATRYIRAFEAQVNRPPVPIIAFTANNASVDCQTCLEAGMNDYLVKPASRESLSQILAYWLDPQHQLRTCQPTQKQLASLCELLDEGALGPEILAHVIQIYLQDSPLQILTLRQALAKQDLLTLRRIAHTLKSASFSLKGQQLGEICAELEKQAQLETSEREKAQLLNELEAKHQMFVEILQTFSQQYLTVSGLA